MILFEDSPNTARHAASRVLAGGGAGHDRSAHDRCHPRHRCSLVDRLPVVAALLAGAAAAPTDAAAVAVLLRRAGAAPERLLALLEVEFGLNDPMSVFLTLLLLRLIAEPGAVGGGDAVRMCLEEMAGGAVIGLAGGWIRAASEAARAGRLARAGAGADRRTCRLRAGTAPRHQRFPRNLPRGDRHRRDPAPRATGGSALLRRNGVARTNRLVLDAGLLVTPHDLPPYLPGAIIGAAVLILLARPVAVFACLIPFGFTMRENAFASWVGLRGAVPIYLSIIPGLVDPNRDKRLFASIFIVVIASLIVQGWTVGLAARLLGFGRRPGARQNRSRSAMNATLCRRRLLGQGFRCGAESARTVR